MASLSSLNFRLTANIAPFRKGLNKAERSMDNFGRKMQQTGKNLSMKLTAPLAALGAVSFNVFKGFEAEMSKVQAVSGATAEEFKALSQNAKDLGASTMFSAREVASLQTEFAKLGFSATEITKVTGATLALAQASGTDLARAAEVAGSTLRAFGLDASQTNVVTDVMAKSFSTSALDMETFAESMKYVAPVAKSAGMSIQQTSAMLAIMADAGIKGSQAGTSLRRIISDLGATGGDVQGAIKKLSTEGLNLADAKDEVGRSAQSALLVLAAGVDRIAPLTKEYKNSGGAAQEMADIMGATAFGASKRLESAMEGLGISIGEIVAQAVVPLIEKLAKLAGKLNQMSPAAKKTAVVIAAIVGAIGPLMFLTGGLIRNFTLLRAAMIKSNATTKIAAAVTRVFNVALKSNPIGVTIGLIASLTAAFVLFNKKKKEAVEMESKLSDSANENISNMQLEQKEMNNLFNALKNGNLKSDQRRSIINKLNTEYTDYLPNLISEKSGIDDIALAQKEANKQFRKKIALVAFQDEITQATEKAVTAQKDLNTLTKAFNDQVAKGVDPRKIRFYQKDLEKLGVTSVSVGRDSKTLDGLQFSLNKTIGESQEEVAALEGNIEALGTSMDDGADGASNQAKGIKNVGEAADKAKDPIADFADEISRLIALRSEYADAESAIADNFEDVEEDAEEFDHSFRKAYETAKMFAAKYKELGNEIANVMHRTSVDTIAGMAEIAGAMVMGEASFKDLGKFLLGQFAGLLDQLGRMFIQYGISVKAFVKALALGPTPMGAALAVGAGIAMVAAAGAIRASMSKAAGGDIPAMAEGGIVTGPTLALIGEGRESEAVIPLSKLNTMMQGGGGQNVVVTGRISGADILLSNERASRNRTRQRGF
jgi:phage-related minor tail protein